MPISPDLADMIASAHSFAERADPISLPQCSNNSAVAVHNVRQFVVATPELDELFSNAERACRDLGRVDAWNEDQLSEAKAAVDISLKALRLQLDRAEPNSHAKALGLDWWPDR